jgi:Phytanoyl-CoA dioxygenase (PhyH)
MRPAPDRELGRLLDRAAGALDQTHPGLAAELTDRAAREHEPPDPFDRFTGDAEVDWFRSFGYLVLRRFFQPTQIEELREELVRTMLGVHGDGYYERPAMSGMAGHYTCLLGPWAPRTTEHVDSRRLVGLAERLVGGNVLPSPCDTQGVLYFGHSGWHNDTGLGVRGVKFVAYLEPLEADSGALRVLPGSHRATPAALGHLHSLDIGVFEVPSQVLATQPGDVIVFDPLLWHATSGGRDRHQWTTSYLRDVISPSWQPGLRAWYEDGAQDIDEQPVDWRPFDRTWVAEGSGDVADPRLSQRQTWMYRLNQLGILDLFGVGDVFRP